MALWQAAAAVGLRQGCLQSAGCSLSLSTFFFLQFFVLKIDVSIFKNVSTSDGPAEAPRRSWALLAMAGDRGGTKPAHANHLGASNQTGSAMSRSQPGGVFAFAKEHQGSVRGRPPGAPQWGLCPPLFTRTWWWIATQHRASDPTDYCCVLNDRKYVDSIALFMFFESFRLLKSTVRRTSHAPG